MSEPVMLSRRLAERTKSHIDCENGVDAPECVLASPTPSICQLTSDWQTTSEYRHTAWKATGKLHPTVLNETYLAADEIEVDIYAESKIGGCNTFVLAVNNGLWWAVAPVNAVQFGVTTSELVAGGTCDVTVGSGGSTVTITGVGCFLLNSGDTIPTGSKVVCVWRMSPVEKVYRWEIISMRCAQ